MAEKNLGSLSILIADGIIHIYLPINIKDRQAIYTIIPYPFGKKRTQH